MSNTHRNYTTNSTRRALTQTKARTPQRARPCVIYKVLLRTSPRPLRSSKAVQRGAVDRLCSTRHILRDAILVCIRRRADACHHFGNEVINDKRFFEKIDVLLAQPIGFMFRQAWIGRTDDDGDVRCAGVYFEPI